MIGYNRPETMKRVLDSVRLAEPHKLYVAIDGPKNEMDTGKVEEARSLFDDVDWCELHTRFRPENPGCDEGVVSAIDWFFQHEERGIILEDDCVADASFYPYASMLLDRYVREPRVMMISGTNYLFERGKYLRESYFFSDYFAIWGWATWRRAWSLYEKDFSRWNALKGSCDLDGILNGSIRERKFISNMLDRACSSPKSAWDAHWFYTCLLNCGLAATPRTNLVSNIGDVGEHSNKNRKKPSIFLHMPVYPLDMNSIIDPEEITINQRMNKIAYKTITLNNKGGLYNLAYRYWGNVVSKLQSSLLG